MFYQQKRYNFVHNEWWFRCSWVLICTTDKIYAQLILDNCIYKCSFLHLGVFFLGKRSNVIFAVFICDKYMTYKSKIVNRHNNKVFEARKMQKSLYIIKVLLASLVLNYLLSRYFFLRIKKTKACMLVWTLKMWFEMLQTCFILYLPKWYVC